MKFKVCFVALNAYPAIDPEDTGQFGGIETRSWAFAQGLAQLPEFEVSFLVRHTEKLREKQFCNVKMLSILDPYSHIRTSLLFRLQRSHKFPWIQLKQPRLADAYYLPLLAINKTLRKRIDPRTPEPRLANIETDALLTFGVQSHSASVIAAAKKLSVPSILFLGSDSDLDENYLPGNKFISTYGDSADVCYWTIQNADYILCQTETQRQRLKTLFQRDAELIKNPIDVADWEPPPTREIDSNLLQGLNRFALWVGRADPVHKRPQDVIEVARHCPEIPFLVIMNKRDEVFETQLKQFAPENVTFIEHVPFEVMPAVFSKAAIFMNTSSLEGFPNTFLQAAATNVPIVSLNVEEKFLQQANAGFFAAGSIEKFAELVQSIWDGTASPCHGKEYVLQHHDLNQQVELLASSIKRIVAST